VGTMTMNMVRSVLLIVVAFFLFKTMRKKES